MNTLTQLFILGGLFILLNFLDGLTTYINLFKLPEGLQGKEANPLFKDIKKNFRGAMLIKAFFVMGGVWLFLELFNTAPGQGLYLFAILDFTFGFVVLNNFYVFVRKKITKKPCTSPLGYVSKLFQKFMPLRVADILSYYLVITCLLIISIMLVNALW